MKVVDFKRKDKDKMIKSLENLLHDVKEDKIATMLFIYLDDKATWGYHMSGIKNRFEAAGYAACLSNMVLHEEFIREEV